MLANLHWGLDPVLLELGPIKLRWYGICFAAGFLVGYSIMQRIFRAEGRDEKDLDSLCVSVVIGTIVGARLGHCFFYDPSFYLSYPVEILKIWEGGLASHGGVIGVAIALWWYARKRSDQSFLWITDRVCLSAASAAAFIRLGNFFNSEIVGTPTDAPWGVIFTSYLRTPADPQPRHPTMLYEAASYAVIFFLLRFVYRRFGSKTPRGLILGLLLVTLFGVRFLLEYVKVAQAKGMEDAFLKTGQWLSIPAVLLGAWLIVRSRKTVTAP